MIACALLGVVLQSSAGMTAGRYELSERLKRLDFAWMGYKANDRRRAAIESITGATAAFFAGRGSDAAQALDEAIAKLEGRRVRSSDALNIRPERPISEPGATVTLKLTWAYRPGSVIPVRVGVGSQEVDVRPGSTTSLSVNPWIANPELRLNQEVGYLMPVRVGNDLRYVYLSFVRRIDDRLRRLSTSENRFVSDLGKLVSEYQSRPEGMETELPLVQYVFAAEAVEDGKAKVGELEQVFYARQGSTIFRAAFPKGRGAAPLNVVIAVHGAGGSENMFFEAYGRGTAVTEALKRGWAFIGVRAGASSLDDALEWLAKVRGVQVGKVFLMGHSMGGGLVLGARARLHPAAVAVFAPATRSLDEAADVPLFVALGKSDPMAAALAPSARGMAGREGFEFQEIDPCEHLMVVADSIPAAYAFFDRYR